MKKSPLGLDTIELTKRYNHHKNDISHVANDPYMKMQEKGFQIRSRKIRFNKSLRPDELSFIHELVMVDLGELK